MFHIFQKQTISGETLPEFAYAGAGGFSGIFTPEENAQIDAMGVQAARESFHSLVQDKQGYVEFLAEMQRLSIENAPKRHITKLAFRNRFTTTEKITIEIACLDDPSAPMTQRQMAAALRSSQADINAASYIDLDRQDTRDGVLALEAAGLLAAGRALIILDDPIQQDEKLAN